MNTLEAHSEVILDKEDTCAKMTIDDTASAFLISDVMRLEEQYTLSFWLRSDAPGTLNIQDVTFSSDTEWSRHQLTFVAESTSLLMLFKSVGIYYIYHMQLELGNVATDWRPAPEDLASESDVAALSDLVQQVNESILSIDTKSIKGQVSELQTKYDTASDEMKKLSGRISTVEQTAESFTMQFNRISEDGVSKLDTGTGYVFDGTGMMVDNTESPTKTQITFKGMFIKSKAKIAGSEDVLTVTDEGVDAANLLARTYLIIGRRSRFENYGPDQTGCFWIGG